MAVYLMETDLPATVKIYLKKSDISFFKIVGEQFGKENSKNLLSPFNQPA